MQNSGTQITESVPVLSFPCSADRNTFYAFMDQKKLFTIGYACFEIDAFIKVLMNFSITAVADIRSQPYSRYKPAFSYKPLKTSLEEAGIRYLFLGDSCGARNTDPDCYVDNRADYGLIAASKRFREGLCRIRESLESSVTALMCAENDPVRCHRNILVCRNLKAPDIAIKHILFPAVLELNEQTEERLLHTLNIRQDELFAGREELLEEAYNRQGMRIACRQKQDNLPSKQPNRFQRH